MRFYITFNDDHSLAGGWVVLLAADRLQAQGYAKKMLKNVWKEIYEEEDFHPELYFEGQIGPVLSLSHLYIDPKTPEWCSNWRLHDD